MTENSKINEKKSRELITCTPYVFHETGNHIITALNRTSRNYFRGALRIVIILVMIVEFVI